MLIQRTANAGVLLKLDGVSILLDGLCGQVGPYLATPAAVQEQLLKEPAHLLAFTHGHLDHYSEALVSTYRKQTLRPILGPENLPYVTDSKPMSVGGVKITPVPSRHIGKVDKNLRHYSFLIEGSKRIWFPGDASPLQWQGREDIPKPDVIIGPYAWCLTESAWRATCALTKDFVLLHMPERNNDPALLWPAVEAVTKKEHSVLHLLEIGHTLNL